MSTIELVASLYYCETQSLNPRFVLVTLLGIEERSQASSSTKSRQEVKKHSSLVHVTSQSPHKIKPRSKEEFQPCACDLAVISQVTSYSEIKASV
jgi:hypothetical protein